MTFSFFDCNCSIGRLGVPQPGSIYSADELIAEMDYLGIEQALVYHTWAREYSPAEGNARLMQELVGYQRLEPCWAVMPHHTGEFPAAAQLVAQLSQQAVKAVRIFPSSAWHNWSLREWSAGPLFSALADQRIPLFVSFDQLSWDDVYALEKAYPQLPLIVTEVRYEELRRLFPLLEALANLHVDLSWTIVHCGLEAMVSRFGATRFLFGSRMPIFSAGPALCYLNYADLPDEDKALIAGGNLRRLLNWQAGLVRQELA
jgi:hypothetical protein